MCKTSQPISGYTGFLSPQQTTGAPGSPGAQGTAASSALLGFSLQRDSTEKFRGLLFTSLHRREEPQGELTLESTCPDFSAPCFTHAWLAGGGLALRVKNLSKERQRQGEKNPEHREERAAVASNKRKW